MKVVPHPSDHLWFVCFVGVEDAAALGVTKSLASARCGPTFRHDQKQLPLWAFLQTFRETPLMIPVEHTLNLSLQHYWIMHSEIEYFSMLVAGVSKAALNALPCLNPMNPTLMAKTILRQATANNMTAPSTSAKI
ncbi:unnamed protein product [Cylindrotheca closterium]|uniref:Uncharacterized protein n=1 Tax=Cylindrotheca closterium TaxID=2856 RepID=A0AAD2FZR0_9STRA|nr:unnamed protein product [Cylindrotheca closterium]